MYNISPDINYILLQDAITNRNSFSLIDIKLITKAISRTACTQQFLYFFVDYRPLQTSLLILTTLIISLYSDMKISQAYAELVDLIGTVSEQRKQKQQNLCHLNYVCAHMYFVHRRVSISSTPGRGDRSNSVHNASEKEVLIKY